MVFNINTNELSPFDREVRKKQITNRKKENILINHYKICPIIEIAKVFISS